MTVRDGPPRTGDSVLLMRRKWLDKILDGTKTMETRKLSAQPKELFFGMGGYVFGRATLTECVRIKREQWAELRNEHCVQEEERPYGDETHGWRLANAVRFETPIPYFHKNGAVTLVNFQKSAPPAVEVRVVNRRPEGEFATSVYLFSESSNIELLYELVKHSSERIRFETGTFELCLLVGPDSRKTVLEEYKGNGDKKTLRDYGLGGGGTVFVVEYDS